MKRLILLAVIIGLALSLAVGCGDDDASLNPIVKEDGDFSDPEFQAALDAYRQASIYTSSTLYWVDALIDMVTVDSGALIISDRWITVHTASDSYLLEYHNSSQYWYLCVCRIDTIRDYAQEIVDIQSYSLEDSIQFLQSATPVQWPDTSLLTGMKNGIRLTSSSTATARNVNLGQLITVTGDFINMGDVTIEGRQDLEFTKYLVDADSCGYNVDVSTTARDIQVHLGGLFHGDCPTNGTLKSSGNLGVSCSGDTTLSFNDNWTVTEIFYPDSMLVVFENSTTRWKFWEECWYGGTIVLEPLGILMAFKP
ncbi:MAG: hypothetical protein AB1483_12365 [Candidatus Zixiibacteriota bacterium]